MKTIAVALDGCKSVKGTRVTNLKLHRRKFLRLVAGAAALPAISRIASAQSYPTQPVRIVVTFPAAARATSSRAQ